MNRLLRSAIESSVRTGNLVVTDPAGDVHRFGDKTGELVHVWIKSRKAERAIAFDPTLQVGETFINGEVEIGRAHV